MRRAARLLKILLGTALLGLVAILVVNLAVWWGGRRHIVAPGEARPAQVALVLGAYVFPDGVPSTVVQDRLDTALDLYRRGIVGRILVTGDHGRRDYDEVNAMRRYLEERGVPESAIFMDHAGFDTYDSMYRARDVFAVESAVVVTQRFHLPRALYIARRLGLDVQGVVADRHAYVGADWYALREVGARVKAFAEVLAARKPVFLGPVIPITGDGRETRG